MQFGGRHVSRGFGTVVLLLSPLALNGAMLVALAVGHDFMHFSGEMPIALGLTAPAAYVVLRWLVPMVAARLGHPAATMPATSEPGE